MTLRCYDLAELDAWLNSNAPPLIHRKGGNGGSPDNPFEAFARALGAGELPLDVEQLFADMVYLGAGGGGNAHDTLLRCTAALLNRGESIESVVAKGLAALTAAAGRSGKSFDLVREARGIRGMAEDWICKHPEILEPKTESDATPESSTLVFIDMSRWDDEPTPEQEWVVYNRIPRRECVLFSGEGGTGKSIEQLHLSVATVLRLDWLGTTPEQGPALFIDAEDDEKVLHRRTKAIAAHYGATITEMIKGGLHLVSWRGCDAALAVVARNGKIPANATGNLYLAASPMSRSR